MKTYSEYKESVNRWVECIPVHWSESPLKYICEWDSEVLSSTTSPDYELKYVEIGDVDTSGRITRWTEYKFEDSPSRCRRVLRLGDTFITTVRTYLKSVGFVDREIEDLICSTGFCVLRPHHTVLPKYLMYQVVSEWCISKIVSLSDGVSYPSVTPNRLVSISVPVPDLKEQQSIVSFLNHKTALIDSLIEKKKRKIELLKEQRASLISHVVTKGLNPDAEMKDSGVEWIGEIPKQWKVPKLGYHITISQGYPFPSESFTNEPNEYPVIKIGSVTTGLIDTYLTDEVSDSVTYVSDGDLVIGMSGDFVVRLWEGPDSLLNQRCCLIKSSNDLNIRYLYYLSPLFLKVIEDTKYFTTLKNLSTTDLKDSRIPIPPIGIQNQMTSFLDSKTTEIDSWVNQEKESIDLLLEYRQSLISEAVTGKIDVRDWSPSEVN